MTMMEILSEIRDRQGRDVLLDGKRLLGFFEDYSKGKLKPEFNALRVLVECGGNERIAQLRNAPVLQQQAGLHRLVRELVTEHSMQENMAREICGAVWEAFCGTKAPLSQTETQKPEKTKEKPKNDGRPAPHETEPAERTNDPVIPPENPKQIPPQPKFILQLKQMDRLVLYMLAAGVLGAIGLVATGAWILTASASDWKWALIILALGMLTIRRVVRVWQGKTNDRTIPRWMEILVFVTICIICLILSGGVFISLGAMEINSGFIVISLLCLALLFLCGRLLDKSDRVTSWCQKSGSKLAVLFYVIFSFSFIFILVVTKEVPSAGGGLFLLAWLLNAVFNIYWHTHRFVL